MKKPINCILIVCLILLAVGAGGSYLIAKVSYEVGVKKGLNMGYTLCATEQLFKERQLTDSIRLDSIIMVTRDDDPISVRPKY